jgi:hypothetical protein
MLLVDSAKGDTIQLRVGKVVDRVQLLWINISILNE